MLYRLRPDGSNEWVDVFRFRHLDAAPAETVDLDRLGWQPADRRLDNDTLRAALRFGRASRVGIVVDPVDLVVVDQPRDVRESSANLAAHRPALRETLAKLDSVIPGTLDADDASYAAVEESTARTLARLDAEREATWRIEPKQDLVDHWTGLGGSLPDPV